eukprot:924339-Pyramimonas_sp.AAC.1
MCTESSGIHLQRWLPHVRTNVKAVAKTQNEESKKKLRRLELLDSIDKCITSPAWFPDGVE